LPISRHANVQFEEAMDWQAELKAKTKLDQLGIFDDVEIEKPITYHLIPLRCFKPFRFKRGDANTFSRLRLHP